MTAAILPFPSAPARRTRPRRRVELAREHEPQEQRPTLRRAWGVVASVAGGGLLAVEVNREIRILSDGRSRAWLSVADGEYLLRWPRLALRRSFWTTISTADLRRGLLLALGGRAPDGLCLQIGCEWYDRHSGPHSDGAVVRLLGDRQGVLPWGV